jgi:hypothetical protein
VQALSLGNVCLFLVLIQFLTNKTPPLECVRLLPLPASCLVCLASLASVGPEILKYFNGEVPFLETYLVRYADDVFLNYYLRFGSFISIFFISRYLQFNLGLLCFCCAYVINDKFMKFHVIESEFSGMFSVFPFILIQKANLSASLNLLYSNFGVLFSRSSRIFSYFGWNMCRWLGIFSYSLSIYESIFNYWIVI